MNIKTLLIANRGEIACRIARAARNTGITPIAVHSDADANGKHVRDIGRSIRLGAAPASESYLDIGAVLAAADQVAADAVHPGYGFLAENPDFASAVEKAGLVFVGPTPETLTQFGDKALAKAAAIKAGVPVIPGSDGAFSDPVKIATETRKMGFPILLKAIGGGGGRGQRLVTQEDTLEQDITAALREAKNAFNSEGLLLERMIDNARHVEIQIAGDGQGNVIHLFERDCSLQRRHQKVIEEAPAFGLPRKLLDKIAGDAVRLCQSLNYRGLGTVEFLVTGKEYFFLEVNPRLQVEHPVTEAVTNIDLVQLHLRIAAGDGLGLDQTDIALNGHAIEARVYAEDPANDFAPSTGVISALAFSQDVRIESGVDTGDEVTPYYDPMIAKLIVHEPDRDAALRRLGQALEQTAVTGVDTNLDFLTALAINPDVKAMQIHTRWIDTSLDELVAGGEPDEASLVVAMAAAIWTLQKRHPGGTNPWVRRDLFTSWRLGLGNSEIAHSSALLITHGGMSQKVSLSSVEGDGHMSVCVGDNDPLELSLEEREPGYWRVVNGSEILILHVRTDANRIELASPTAKHILNIDPALPEAFAGGTDEGSLGSPLTGAIVAVLVKEGDSVPAGETIAILESMKLEIPIKSVQAGTVASLDVAVGDMVDRGQIIAEIATINEE